MTTKQLEAKLAALPDVIKGALSPAVVTAVEHTLAEHLLPIVKSLRDKGGKEVDAEIAALEAFVGSAPAIVADEVHPAVTEAATAALTEDTK